MAASAALRFWEAPVEPTVPVDLEGLPLYRTQHFPSSGPEPWLDVPDAEARIAERLDRGEITAEEAALCRKWSRDGYVILEGYYPSELLDRTWSDYEAAIARGELEAPDEPLYPGDPWPGRVANVHFTVPSLDGMLYEPRMGHLISVLLGAQARPFQTIIGHKSSQQLEHSDSIHMSTYPAGYLAANWIAYEDVDPDSGPLVYYPGSHKLPYLMAEELGIPAETNYAAYHARYEPRVQALIAEHGLEPHYFLPKRGDVLIWHANLLHGGSKVRNVELTRKALVCHFFAEGCVCYHDLTGTPTHTQLGLDLYRFKRPSGEAALASGLRTFLKRALRPFLRA
jgi:hypothetical protein